MNPNGNPDPPSNEGGVEEGKESLPPTTTDIHDNNNNNNNHNESDMELGTPPTSEGAPSVFGASLDLTSTTAKI